jgi:hypothetical protein
MKRLLLFGAVFNISMIWWTVYRVSNDPTISLSLVLFTLLINLAAACINLVGYAESEVSDGHMHRVPDSVMWRAVVAIHTGVICGVIWCTGMLHKAFKKSTDTQRLCEELAHSKASSIALIDIGKAAHDSVFRAQRTLSGQCSWCATDLDDWWHAEAGMATINGVKVRCRPTQNGITY